MQASKKTIVWFLISFVLATTFGVAAFKSPMKFVPMSDLLATIISILIGVSIAISAVLSAPPKISGDKYGTKDAKERAQGILNSDYLTILNGQHLLFWFYYASLLLAVLLKFLHVYFGHGTGYTLNQNAYFKVVAAAFAFVSSLALLWSATLPSLLHQVNTHKMKF